MTEPTALSTRILDLIFGSLDVPPSYYQKAANRYRSVGEWLHRDGSAVVDLEPEVFPQGSFRYGTVIKPVNEDGAYDLDMACQVNLSKLNCTQEQVKALLGEEIASYARAQSFKDAPEAKHRCWRLNYADEAAFHLDIVPCIPESPEVMSTLMGIGVPEKLASMAVAITDDRRKNFKVIDSDWPSSNPEGFAEWFVQRMKTIGPERMMKIASDRKVASIDDLPTYAWKTPLQRAIQILKRHRDVVFKDQEHLKPVSVLITTLAAIAYGGEADLFQALDGILSRMPSLVRPEAPRVPNPLNPKEDFADRWQKDPRLEKSFRLWVARAKADLDAMGGGLDELAMADLLGKEFGIKLSDDLRKSLVGAGWSAGGGSVVTAAPAIHIHEAAKPWSRQR